ncbi:MAG: D-sedoheptulose 7-phosphate isomerase [archaeon]
MSQEIIRSLINDSLGAQKSIYDSIPLIEKASHMIIEAIKKGNKLLICGNGGSAAQAQHFTAELVGRFEAERKGLPCISLTVDTSNLTALSNDYGYEVVFARQVEALGNPGDILIGLSTSGNSGNILRTIEKARERNMQVINLLGRDGGKMKGLGEVDLIVPVQNTARIQEVHILILHILAKLIEDEFVAN